MAVAATTGCIPVPGAISHIFIYFCTHRDYLSIVLSCVGLHYIVHMYKFAFVASVCVCRARVENGNMRIECPTVRPKTTTKKYVENYHIFLFHRVCAPSRELWCRINYVFMTQKFVRIFYTVNFSRLRRIFWLCCVVLRTWTFEIFLFCSNLTVIIKNSPSL